ncbi:MAG: hypothetical protein LC798_20790 [Chloroflexi bacterium]|nr:hypothetical protein [Chloroflexota bacterium]
MVTIELSARVAIQQRIGDMTDTLLAADQLTRHMDEHELLARVTAATGDVASDIVDNACLDLDATLVHLCAEAQVWLEIRSRRAAT